MARINTNISSVIAQANLTRSQSELNVRLERLSTGLRINRGKDDPAGLIISERIRSDIKGVEQGIKNTSRASSVISTTEAALGEVNDLLNSMRSLIVESANTGANSSAEREANQLQIDSAIDSITRISDTATFGRLKLLNGSLDYTLSGLKTSAVSRARVTNASFVGADNLQVEVDVIASAQKGALFYNGQTDPANPGVTLSAMTLQIAGPEGVQEISILSGQPLNKIRDAVNKLTALTGVQASLINNNAASGLIFKSAEYGSEEFVAVRRLSGPSSDADSFKLYKFPDTADYTGDTAINFGSLIEAYRDEGRDVSALVNGNLATGRGLEVKVNSSALGIDLLLNEDLAIRPSGSASAFYITGGGALFQLGPNVTALQQASFGVPSVAASNLGSSVINGRLQTLNSLKTGGENSIANSVSRSDFSDASTILNRAIDEITTLRGRFGAFERNVLDTTTRSLQAQFENLTASDSEIRDADFAAETSKLTRAQILNSAGTSVLSLANQQSQQVLQLLG